jgi:hypothetical protein
MSTTLDTSTHASSRLAARRTNLVVTFGWITTGLFAAMMIGSGILYVSGFAPVAEGIRTLGYPDSFRVLIGVAKLLGAPMLLIPRRSMLREWAYAGFVFDLGGAIVAHLSHGDGVEHVVPIVFGLALLLSSYVLRARSARR